MQKELPGACVRASRGQQLQALTIGLSLSSAATVNTLQNSRHSHFTCGIRKVPNLVKGSLRRASSLMAISGNENH